MLNHMTPTWLLLKCHQVKRPKCPLPIPKTQKTLHRSSISVVLSHSQFDVLGLSMHWSTQIGRDKVGVDGGWVRFRFCFGHDSELVWSTPRAHSGIHDLKIDWVQFISSLSLSRQILVMDRFEICVCDLKFWMRWSKSGDFVCGSWLVWICVCDLVFGRGSHAQKLVAMWWYVGFWLWMSCLRIGEERK